MRVHRIVTNLAVGDIEESKSFYTDFLGLNNEEFNLGWVARYSDAEAATSVQLVTHDATSPDDSVISAMTEDVEDAYEEALRLGLDIVHPLTREAWGVHRFLVRAPDGNVINIVGHPHR
nr:VOC family protein [Rhodococcus sp. (in: high G+C Gram-positive bacteria)]